MELHLLAIAMLVHLDFVIADSVEDPDLTEYCQWEGFSAKCAEDEVIVIERAYYGRMRYGRCIKRDYGYVGCYSDVRHLAEQRCSGRRQCRIVVPSEMFDGTKPCPEDLKMYLTAKYRCQKVVVVESMRHQCRDTQPVTSSAQNDGYLSSYVTDETGCGSTTTPWLVSVEPGQSINITLLDFAGKASAANGSSSSVSKRGDYTHCLVYAIIKERGFPKATTVCGGTRQAGPAEKQVFFSTTSSVEIRIVTRKSSKREGHFLIHYKASGCADIAPSGDQTWRRNGQTAEMECRHTPQIWRLTCADGKWRGPMGNCSDSSSPGLHTAFHSMSHLAKSSSIVIVVGIAFVIGLCILTIGLFIIRRRRKQVSRSVMRHGERTVNRVTTKDEDAYMTTNRREFDYGPHPPLLSRPDNQVADENEYAYVEEFQFSGPPSCACACTNESARVTLAATMSPVKDQDVITGKRNPARVDVYSLEGNTARRLLKDRNANTNASGHSIIKEGGAPQYFVLDPDGPGETR